MASPPLIGITAGNDPQMPEHYVLRWDYVRSVTAVGGIPVILAPGKAAEDSGYLDRFDGLIFSGGADIHPQAYGQIPRTELRWPSEERDRFELDLMRRALSVEMPVLAICRGMQVLNVALGGSLIQDLPSEFGEQIHHDDLERPRNTIAHDVKISAGSRLSRSLPDERSAVNSFHHQAIDQLAPDLVATAYADDGIIEAIEIADHFVLGVQWHPECFWYDGTFLSLFDSLVQEASRT